MSEKKTLTLPEKPAAEAKGPSISNREDLTLSVLQSWANKEARVFAETIDGGASITGKLAGVDRFTVHIQADGRDGPTIVFKHALRSIREA